jgi:ARC6-like, IMS domain/DnaJ domain
LLRRGYDLTHSLVNIDHHFESLLGKEIVRIPLDYYRILGLPIQATAEQVRQAHRDRTLQLPRREYSETAIAARKQLIDGSFAVLSNPQERQAYDTLFLATPYDIGELNEDPALMIEIEDHQLVGALLILQELGEYELVLKLGRPYLSSGTVTLKDGKFGDPKIALSDIVLTVALSCLELGREQWQQGQYENAAEALETGQELLLREGLFVGVRGEIQSDLFKLRPYRILELLAQPDGDSEDRGRGIQLLQDMLQERGGIDGTGDDLSGLSVDDFLRFIQQLRGYLTAEEQQHLFEEEARRPSAVATYLAVYALLARGFAEHQPALIRRAKAMLMKLSSRQDVHLEQSVCALLLGQTEEANRVLEFSQEFEPLAFIREKSIGAPDLLPGLCLYAERWLQEEVFPHFRDLAKRTALLKDYFADEQVQAYLEDLPSDAEAPSRNYSATVTNRSHQPAEVGRDRGRSATATMAVDRGVAAAPTAERVAHLSPEGSLQDRRRASRNGSRVRTDGDLPKGRNGATAHPGNRKARSLKLIPFLLGFAAVGLLGFLLVKSFRALMGGGGGASSDQTLEIQLDKPVLQIGSQPAEVAVGVSGTMNQATAEAILKTWFDAKKEALGSGYSTSKLSQILVDPKLSEWKRNSEEAKRDGLTIEYDHSVKVDRVEVSPTDPTQATVVATVTEIRQYTQSGQPSETQNDADMQVKYSLVQQNNQWLIKDWQ